ncbi:MAG TPA: family 16 glycoside hydrolase, partial [Tepidisphaeraceae bacterium]|nr:family 16 glycoside hydrolase [Tepidisphaeraceae bacterium]
DRGQWQARDGLLRQTGNPRGGIAFAGDPGWSDYTLSLKARKIGGAEGFLILFHVADARNYTWWNIGGWGNTRHGIEQFADAANNGRIGESVNGSIEIGRWYDVRVEVKGPTVRCYLDGSLIHQADYPAPRTLFATASRADDGQIILKVVNAGRQPQSAAVSLQGLTSVDPVASITVLTGQNDTDENSFEQPTRVAPVQRQLDGIAGRFTCDFPANSVNVLRIKGASR